MNTFLIWPSFMVGDGSKLGAKVVAASPSLAVSLWHHRHPKASPGGRPIDVTVRELDYPDEPDAVYSAHVEYVASRK